jgi:hypothetical protein
MIHDIKAHYQTVVASEEYARRFHPGADNPKRRKRKAATSDGLLDIPAAASRLNITAEKVRAFVRDGDLKYVNVGHGSKKPRYRFEDSDINAFIEKRRQQDIPPCQSSKPQSPRRIIGTTSRSNVVGFMAQRAAQLAKNPKNSKH